MKEKKEMLTNSSTECAWTCVGVGLSMLLIGITGACNQYPVFYCSALVQAINNVVLYAGVRKRTHKTFPFCVSIVLRVFAVVALELCIAYFYVSASSPPSGSLGEGLYKWLASFSGCLWTTIFLVGPFVASIVEGIGYMVEPDVED